ncbi:MAG: SUF system Fe-S cluster assembly protein [Arenicella sp.]
MNDKLQDTITTQTPADSNAPSKEELHPQIIEALKTVYDPEIPVNIYDLGLIYDVVIDDDYFVDVSMTLTAPGCPVAETFPGIVENTVKSVTGVSDARVELTFEPPWRQDMMSEEALLELGMI